MDFVFLEDNYNIPGRVCRGVLQRQRPVADPLPVAAGAHLVVRYVTDVVERRRAHAAVADRRALTYKEQKVKKF